MNEELKPLKKSVGSKNDASEVMMSESSKQSRWWSHWILQTIFVVIAVRLIGLLATLLGIGVFYFTKRKHGATKALVAAVLVSFAAAVASIFIVREFL